jgi:hypothetical protein
LRKCKNNLPDAAACAALAAIRTSGSVVAAPFFQSPVFGVISYSHIMFSIGAKLAIYDVPGSPFPRRCPQVKETAKMN